MSNVLKKITEALIGSKTDYSAIRTACAELRDLFCTASGFDFLSKENQQHLATSAGLAVSPYAAVLCITDMMRTRKFLLGIKEAIAFKLSQNPERPVKILYAGCGPFATLLVPLTTVFTPAQLQMVLMDINPPSIQYLQKTIHYFSIEEYVLGVEHTDALQYSIPEKYQPDILVSETMKPGLAKEPQVSVISHLLPQCRDNTILIPEKIIVDACLLGNIANNPDAIQFLQNLLEFDAATATQIKNKHNDVPVFGSGLKITLNEKPSEIFSRIDLNTTINIYGNNNLGFNESSLTIPVPVLDIATIKNYPARFLFQYQISDNPGFNIKAI